MERILYSKSDVNIGLCSGVNKAYKKTKNTFVYSHDDMYFLPNWDKALVNEIHKIKIINFTFRSTQIASNWDQSR